MSPQNSTPPHPNRPFTPHVSDVSDLSSLLSTSSYPEHESFSGRWPKSVEDQVSLYGGYRKLSIENGTRCPQADTAALSDLPGHTSTSTIPQEHSAPRGKDKSGTKVRSQKKRGRPRKDSDDPTEPQEERRRRQIRLAQRAYRGREKVVLSQQEARIMQLETSIKQLNSTIHSFGDNLARSGVLASHSDLHVHLLNTFTTCKSIVEDTGIRTEEQDLTPSKQTEASISQSGQGMTFNPSLSVQFQGRQGHTPFLPSPMSALSLQTSSPPLGHGSPLLFDNITTATTSTMDLPLFVRQLRIACAYHAFFSLRDYSVKLDDLRRKFRFLLSILTRENLISYFEAGIAAKIHPERMLEWEELPFFRVGGAGTHFLPSSLPRYESQHPIREDPLDEFPSDVQGEMDGRWYDIRDLEGLLQERGVQLVTGTPTEPGWTPSNPAAINPSNLIKILVKTCICLGRSPGWRPLDVETALRMSHWET